MTPARASAVIRQIGTLDTVAEAEGFKAAIRDNGEQMTTEAMQAWAERTAVLRKREARG